MHVLFVTGNRNQVDAALRVQNVTSWTINVMGDQLPFNEATTELNKLSTMEIDSYHGVVLIGVPPAVPMTIFTVARLIILRGYIGKLLAIAKADISPRHPSEARRYFRNVGVRNDQFVPTLEAAIERLNS